MNNGTDGTQPVQQVIDAVTQWPAVSRVPHVYDGVEFQLDDYEFGHVHRGWQQVHINYPRQLREALIDEGHTAEHPHFPDTGWTSAPVRDAEEVENAIWLLRVSYLYRALTRRQKPAGQTVLDAIDVSHELDDLDVSDEVRAVFERVMELPA